MAKIRIGIGSDFRLKDQKLGLGENNPQERLDVAGVAKGQDLKVTGISSLTAYEGFLRADHQIAENTTLSFDQGPVSSLSGEIIVGTGQTVTVNEIVKETVAVGNGSGDQWFDINGNHAFVKVGTPTWNGNTFTLDGTDDYFTASGGDKDDFGFGTGDFTIEMWINAASASIVPYDTRPASTNGDYATIFIDSGTPNFYVNGANRISGSSGDFPASVWNHFVISRISSTTKMYINGVQKGSDYSDSTNYVGSSGRPFIGAQSRTVGGSDVTGQISIVRVYKGRGLTLAEVTLNYNAGYTATTSAVAATVDLNANNPASYPGTVRDVDTTNFTRAGGSEIECLKVYNTFTPPSGGTNERPYAPKPGELYYNYDFKTIEFFDGYGWRQVDNTTRSGRGLFGGGRVGSTPYNIIDFINIQSLGNAQDFGDMQQTAISPTACSSELRGIFAGGYAPASGLLIDYVTIASAGDALDFGDLTDARRFASATSSSTRGVFMAGRDNPANNAMDVIDYIEIGTLGNALDFGNLATADMRGSAAGDGKRGIYIAGNQAIPAGTSQNQFITIASKGNGTNFGSLQKTRQYHASSANSTRMVTGGGSDLTPSVETLIIQSLGNSVEFGDLTVDRYHFASTATQTRAVWAGGSDGSTDNYNVIDYLTLSTGGSAIDFGDLTLGRYSCSGCSDSHGGLGGF